MTPSLKRWLRRWFDPREPVDARTYLATGTLLMAFKYATDAVLVGVVTGALWRPTDYLNPLVALRAGGLRDAPDWLFWVLAAWSAPFLYVGASMTMRRALDAGRSAWWAMLFFVPGLNYLAMLVLAALPTSPERGTRVVPRVENASLPGALLAAAAALAVVIPSVVLGALVYRRYSAGLFLGTPFTLGVVTAWFFNRRHLHTLRHTFLAVTACIGIVAVALMTLALEGAVCIVMAAPLAFLVALPGAALGRELAIRGSEDFVRAGAAIVLTPLAAGLFPTPPPALREVSSAIVVDAPPDVVWRHVVSFGALQEPPSGIFRLGVAYPVRASISGTGVGAIRRCEFSTGPFIEPITTWDAPRRLAFDVTSSPPPLREWSPYRHVDAPHLDGFLRSRRGEFRLVALPGNRTRLEGSTWYQLDVHPVPYWSLFAEPIIAGIHLRVLRHVRSLAEAERNMP